MEKGGLSDESSKRAALLDADENLREDLKAARRSCYAYQFFGSAGWAIYNVVFSYYLVRVGGMSISEAALYSALQWVAYATAQFCSNPVLGAVSDRIGRRPVLIGSGAVVAFGLCLYCYPVGWFWIVVGAVQGACDGTWAMVNAITVDCVAAGAPLGDESDAAFSRFFRSLLRGSWGGGGQEVAVVESRLRTELSVSLSILQVIGGLGSLAGYLAGFALSNLPGLGLIFALMCAGLASLPALAYIYATLPETKKPAMMETGDGGEGGVPGIGPAVRAAFAAQMDLFKIVARNRRAVLLLVAYFACYMGITGTIALGFFWGRETAGWPAGYTTGFFIMITIAPALGMLVATRALFPVMGFSRGIALLFALSALGFALINACPNYVSVLFAAVLGAASWGVYPTMTGLLTPEVHHDVQGQLQGFLFGITTLGSLCALALWLTFFYCVSYGSIWWLAASCSLVAAITVKLAGDGDVNDEALPGNTPSSVTINPIAAAAPSSV